MTSAGRRNPSMVDVAVHARVSIATVSNVINRPEKVKAATAQRVRESIAALGFVRNSAARSLAVGSSTGIGMVLADLENSLFVDMAHGAQAEARRSGFRLLLGDSLADAALQDEYLSLFDEARVAGLLLAPMEDSSIAIARMRSHGRPIVLLNYAPSDAICCTVLVDNEMVGYVAARHLIEVGCRRIAFVAGRDFLQPVHDRRDGVQRAVREAGGGVQLEEIDIEELTRARGARVAADLLEREHGLPDGIIAVTDALGHGIIDGLNAGDVARVPREILVMGCEDNRLAPSAPVTMTSVHPPGLEMGAAAVQLLLEEMDESDGPHQHRTIVLQPQLMPRESTAPLAVTASQGGLEAMAAAAGL